MAQGILLALLYSVLLNGGWTFSRDAADDRAHGTEYFTYVAKARSADHNTGPAMPGYDDSLWQRVTLPHDWAVDLPFSGEASHSHGYKCIGWKYPGNCIGWYRKHLFIPAQDKGKRVLIEFDGIYRNSQVFCNGFYLGGRQDGYLQQVYDLSDYLEYGADNVIAVRCDATLEEGWYYEGAGIYRNVHLIKTPQAAALPHGIRTVQTYTEGIYSLDVTVGTTQPGLEVSNALIDADGQVVASGEAVADSRNLAFGKALKVARAHEWSMDNPYLYTLRTIVAGKDTTYTRIGLRRAVFDPDKGFILNGKKVMLRGCNLHQDHAGVGAGIPDELWRYRLARLKEYGFNAIRSSHNPATPALLDLCDEMGFAVIDENREFGVNERQLSLLRDMVRRDVNHPCIVLWSVGNEEWSLEGKPEGAAMARKMAAAVHSIDPTRPCTYGNSGGRELVKGSEVFGYNYIIQNPVEEYHRDFPSHPVVGTEETTGAGTRGKYRTVPEEGWMVPHNRRDTTKYVNLIERGWRFYHDRGWTCGLFYWTGFDYRGEPNPMAWPATGSQFGILDYCGFPKDEAFYLKSWWTDEAVLHVCGEVAGEVWVYSNCPEVELFEGRSKAPGKRVSYKSLGRKRMPRDGHLSWKVDSTAVSYMAKGVHNSLSVKDIWPSVPSSASYVLSKDSLKADGQDICVVDITSPEDSLTVSVRGAVILGWGNGNPGFKCPERPLSQTDTSIVVRPFCGRCQVLLRSVEGCSEKLEVFCGEFLR